MIRRSPFRRLPKRDPVTPDVRLAVLTRDMGCVAVLLGEPPSECRGYLQLDHVKSEPMMGKRAPSDPAHLASVCEFHHLGGWATANRPRLRRYLARVSG